MSDAPHVASLTILAGPLKGHVLPVDEAVDDLLIGSDPDCRLVVDLPGISPIHARIWIDPAGATVYNTRSPRGIHVNDSPVEDRAPLRDGDILWLGAPGEADSVMIQFRHPPRAARQAAPEAVAAPSGGEGDG
jgi:pSer/pThr/pTyr-binding forkhead associated (FHA) protein